MPSTTDICLATELSRAPLNRELTLVESRVDQASRIRLATLGLRLGARFSLIARTAGGGRVAVVAGTRVALGRGLLAQLVAEVADR